MTPNYVFILRGILVRIWIGGGFCITWMYASLLVFKTKWFLLFIYFSERVINKTLMNKGDGFWCFTPDEMYWVCLEIWTCNLTNVEQALFHCTTQHSSSRLDKTQNPEGRKPEITFYSLLQYFLQTTRFKMTFSSLHPITQP